MLDLRTRTNQFIDDQFTQKPGTAGDKHGFVYEKLLNVRMSFRLSTSHFEQIFKLTKKKKTEKNVIKTIQILLKI